MASEAQEEIRAVLDQAVQALNTGDGDGLGSVLSRRPDAVHIGTDADEWWSSDDLTKAVSGAGQSETRVSLGEIGVHVLGDVAWVEGKGHFRNSSGGERPVRLTCVLVREDNRWKVTQEHASIGVPNDQIFATERGRER
jgi:uncharacterized protein (TIGR02246 family)